MKLKKKERMCLQIALPYTKSLVRMGGIRKKFHGMFDSSSQSVNNVLGIGAYLECSVSKDVAV